MPSQFLYMLLSYGSSALIVAAMVVGVVLTKGTVRTWLACAVAVEALRFFLALTVPGFIYALGETATFAYTAVSTLLGIAPVILLVGAAIAGARRIAAKDAVISALTDSTTETWQQPENSPDPKLLAD